jgi:G3E family GTPase
MTAKIPATIVTGFLGAGKTSLIRHLLEQKPRPSAGVADQ